MTTLLSTLTAVLVAATPAAGPASNDPTAQAKKAFAEGQKAYTQGKYKDALERFETAYAFKALPLLQYNIARCHERLGETAPALRAYRDFLRLSPNPAEKDAVAKAMLGLQRQLQEKGVQQLLVLTEPARASVEVDGRSIGSSPASVELTAGEHTVVARLPDYEVAAQKLVLATAEMVELKLVLQRPPPAPPPPPVVVDEPRAAVLTPQVQPAVEQQAAPAPRKRVTTWVVGGVGVAALGAGVGLGLASSSASSQLRDGTVRSAADVQALHDATATTTTGANVAYGVAGAALITAVVLFIVEGR